MFCARGPFGAKSPSLRACLENAFVVSSLQAATLCFTAWNSGLLPWGIVLVCLANGYLLLAILFPACWLKLFGWNPG